MFQNCIIQVPMELRPCGPGVEYRGPVRVPVQRSSGRQVVPGVSYRPIKRFFHLRSSADYIKQREHFQEMADNRRAERKAQQEQIRKFGPDISEPDTGPWPLDSSCKILKYIEFDDQIRLYFRRQDPI